MGGRFGHRVRLGSSNGAGAETGDSQPPTHTHTHTHTYTHKHCSLHPVRLWYGFSTVALSLVKAWLIILLLASFVWWRKKKLHIYCKYCIFIFFFCRTKICNHLILLVEFFKGAFLTSHQSLFFNYYFGTISLWSTCLSNTAASKWWQVNTTLRSSVEHLLWLC